MLYSAGFNSVDRAALASRFKNGSSAGAYSRPAGPSLRLGSLAWRRRGWTNVGWVERFQARVFTPKHALKTGR